MKSVFLMAVLLLGFFSNPIGAQTPNWEWVRSATTFYNGQSFADCVDLKGNVYVVGYFNGPGAMLLGNDTLVGNSNADVFIAKYNSSGNVIWARSAEGTGNDTAFSVSSDNAGNVYVVGTFNGHTIHFGSYILTNSDSLSSDIFITKYDSTGNVLWAKNAGGIGNDEAKGVCIDDGGNIYMTGFFKSPNLSLGSITYNNVGGSDIIVAKYDGSGNVLWAGTYGSFGDDAANSICADAMGNIYISGYFSDTMTVGGITLNSAGQRDIFVIKYNTSGNTIWAKRTGGTSDDEAYNVRTDAFGHVYVAGSVKSSFIYFANDTLINLYSGTLVSD